MSTTGSIDLSKLPPLNIVEKLSFEQIFKEMQQSVAGVYPMLFKDNNREPFLADAEQLTDENGGSGQNATPMGKMRHPSIGKMGQNALTVQHK